MVEHLIVAQEDRVRISPSPHNIIGEIMTIFHLAILEKADDLSKYEFFRIMDLQIFRLNIDWFKEVGEWFIYIKTKNWFVRFSSVGFLYKIHINKNP